MRCELESIWAETKIEALALGDAGEELARQRVDTPRGDYDGTVAAIAGLVRRLEVETGRAGTVGMGIPGSLRADGTVKNANSTWLNGRMLQVDISRALGREVRVANDANCLAVSEATDGAGAGLGVVFAVILGTGCGGGVALGGRVHAGGNGVAGEWGHTPLPWAREDELPGWECYCGRRGCMEQWVSGPAVARDYGEVLEPGSEKRDLGHPDLGRVTAREVAAWAENGEAGAVAALERFEDRLGRGLAMVVNVLDPDVIVLGGGLSRVERLYARVPEVIRRYVFGGDFATAVVPARFGDSSGVRGAAWLWPL